MAENLLGKKHRTKVLVLTERGGQHGGFTDAGLKWLTDESRKMNFSITEINNAKPITESYLSQFNLISSWIILLIHGRKRRKMLSSNI